MGGRGDVVNYVVRCSRSFTTWIKSLLHGQTRMVAGLLYKRYNSCSKLCSKCSKDVVSQKALKALILLGF